MTKPDATPRERNLMEAYLFGWSVLCLLIGATLASVFLIMALCGVPFGWTDMLWLVPALLGAAILRFYSRLARTE
jgi:hypothetical protein